MKNQTNGSQNQDYKKLQQFLLAVKEMVKTPSLRKLGFKQLQKLDEVSLPKNLHVRYLYIICRYYTFEFGDSQNIDLLFSANDYAEDMVAIAKEKGVKLGSKEYFVRARVKFLLSKHAKKHDTRKYYHQRASHLTNTSLVNFPDDPHFLWLKSELLKK